MCMPPFHISSHCSGELKASIYTSRFWKLPFVRGIALIGEQMHLGMRSLMWSANMNAGSRDIQIRYGVSSIRRHAHRAAAAEMK